MTYPNELLPKTFWKKIDCDISNNFLLRRTNFRDKSTYWDPETDTLITDSVCSPREQIQDLSCSLFGVYTHDHIYLQLTETGKVKGLDEYCTPNFDADIPLFDEDFIVNENRGYWTINISKVNNLKVSYIRNNKLDDVFTAVGYVLHTPTKSNFWHFSIRWKVDGKEVEDMESKEKAKVARAISNTARVTIAQFAKINEPDPITIPLECYIA